MDSSDLSNVVKNPEKVLKLDKDLTEEEIEEFFRDSDDEECSEEESDDEENFEILGEDIPTEAEKQMFKEDMEKFKENVQQERQKYQPTTTEKLLAVAKSILMRAIIFYVILWLLRRNSHPKNAGVDNETVINDSFEDYDEFGNDEDQLFANEEL